MFAVSEPTITKHVSRMEQEQSLQPEQSREPYVEGNLKILELMWVGLRGTLNLH